MGLYGVNLIGRLSALVLNSYKVYSVCLENTIMNTKLNGRGDNIIHIQRLGFLGHLLCSKTIFQNVKPANAQPNEETQKLATNILQRPPK